MLVLVVGLARARLLIYDHDGWTFGFVVEAAFPILLRPALTVSEVPEVVVHEQMLAGTL